MHEFDVNHLKWIVKRRAIIFRINQDLSLLRLEMECPCVHLFVTHLVAKETRDETNELVRACQIQENEERSSRMSEYYWLICFMNTLLWYVLTGLNLTGRTCSV